MRLLRVTRNTNPIENSVKIAQCLLLFNEFRQKKTKTTLPFDSRQLYLHIEFIQQIVFAYRRSHPVMEICPVCSTARSKQIIMEILMECSNVLKIRWKLLIKLKEKAGMPFGEKLWGQSSIANADNRSSIFFTSSFFPNPRFANVDSPIKLSYLGNFVCDCTQTMEQKSLFCVQFKSILKWTGGCMLIKFAVKFRKSDLEINCSKDPCGP